MRHIPRCFCIRLEGLFLTLKNGNSKKSGQCLNWWPSSLKYSLGIYYIPPSWFFFLMSGYSWARCYQQSWYSSGFNLRFQFCILHTFLNDIIYSNDHRYQLPVQYFWINDQYFCWAVFPEIQTIQKHSV